jgi:serine protease
MRGEHDQKRWTDQNTIMRNKRLRAVAWLTALFAFAVFRPGVALAQDAGSQPSAGLAVPGQILVRVPDGSTTADVETLAREAGCVVVDQLTYATEYYRFRVSGRATRAGTPDLVGAPVTDAMLTAVRRLNNQPGVRAFPDYIVSVRRQNPVITPVIPNDPLYRGGGANQSRQQWHLDMIRMPEAWALQVGVRPVIVAVPDSGLDAEHPDFIGSNGRDLVLRAAGRNFLTSPPSPNYDDDGGHGTHVSGTVAAATNNGIGVASVAGWDLRELMSRSCR